MNYTLTITEADLDAAIAARQQPGYFCCAHCVLAQALKRLGHEQEVGYLFKIGPDRFWVGFATPLRDLIQAFDKEHYDTVRAQLPLTAACDANL